MCVDDSENSQYDDLLCFFLLRRKNIMYIKSQVDTLKFQVSLNEKILKNEIGCILADHCNILTYTSCPLQGHLMAKQVQWKLLMMYVLVK